MDSENIEQLLQRFKKRLRITWEDAVEDDNIRQMIKSGVQYLCSVAGQGIDFENDSVAYDLLYYYILYTRNDSLAAFRAAYSPDLLGLSIKYSARRSLEEVL